MATKLKDFDFGPQSKLTTGKRPDYPWDDWFDGDIWQLTQDEDFDGDPLMMERIIRSRAVGREARVTLRHRNLDGGAGTGLIIFQRTDVVGPTVRKSMEAAKKRAAAKAAKLATVEPAKAEKKVNGDAKAVSKKAPKQRKLVAV